MIRNLEKYVELLVKPAFVPFCPDSCKTIYQRIILEHFYSGLGESNNFFHVDVQRPPTKIHGDTLASL